MQKMTQTFNVTGLDLAENTFHKPLWPWNLINKTDTKVQL